MPQNQLVVIGATGASLAAVITGVSTAIAAIVTQPLPYPNVQPAMPPQNVAGTSVVTFTGAYYNMITAVTYYG